MVGSKVTKYDYSDFGKNDKIVSGYGYNGEMKDETRNDKYSGTAENPIVIIGGFINIGHNPVPTGRYFHRGSKYSQKGIAVMARDYKLGRKGRILNFTKQTFDGTRTDGTDGAYVYEKAKFFRILISEKKKGVGGPISTGPIDILS